jgi:hypothetical protein
MMTIEITKNGGEKEHEGRESEKRSAGVIV